MVFPLLFKIKREVLLSEFFGPFWTYEKLIFLRVLSGKSSLDLQSSKTENQKLTIKTTAR